MQLFLAFCVPPNHVTIVTSSTIEPGAWEPEFQRADSGAYVVYVYVVPLFEMPPQPPPPPHSQLILNLCLEVYSDVDGVSQLSLSLLPSGNLASLQCSLFSSESIITVLPVVYCNYFCYLKEQSDYTSQVKSVSLARDLELFYCMLLPLARNLYVMVFERVPYFSLGNLCPLVHSLWEQQFFFACLFLEPLLMNQVKDNLNPSIFILSKVEPGQKVLESMEEGCAFCQLQSPEMQPMNNLLGSPPHLHTSL